MKYLYLYFILILSIFSSPTTIDPREKEDLLFVEMMKQKGFADRIIDRLHKSIAQNIARIKSLGEKDYLKNSYKYLAQEPVDQAQIDLEKVFFTDKENKTYFKLNLSQGLTIEEYPDKHIFDTKAFVYLTEDGKSLGKVILQFTKANFNGVKYVKEVRRIINPTPFSPDPIKLEGEKINEVKKLQEENITDDSTPADKNDDIIIEYYSMYDKDIPWVNDKPEIENPIAMKNTLNDPKELLPYSSQKKIFDTYRIVLKVLDREIDKKVKYIELNQRAILKKMTEIAY
jgi:hypothetical protein